MRSQSETLSDAGSTGICDCLEIIIIIVVVDAIFFCFLMDCLYLRIVSEIRKGIQSILLLHNWDLHVFFFVDHLLQTCTCTFEIHNKAHLVWHPIDTSNSSTRSRLSVSVSQRWPPTPEMTRQSIPVGHRKTRRTEK